MGIRLLEVAAVHAVQKILIPVDFSEPSYEAISFGTDLARQLGARVYLLHLLEEHPVRLPGAESEGTAEQYVDRRAAEARGRLEEIRSELADLKMQIVVMPGNPAAEIVSYASWIHADLIVMGTHGGRPLARMLLGSTADQVVRCAKCPVLTVREAVVPAAAASAVAQER